MKRIDRFYHGPDFSPLMDTDVILGKFRSGEIRMEDCSDFPNMVELLVRSRERETKIEESLEKVRVSTLAMYSSEQLAETAEVLFEQFRLLGEIPDRMSIGIFEEENDMIRLWVTDQHGNRLSHEFFFSIKEPTSMAKIHAAWKQGKESVVIDLSGQELQTWLQFVKQVAQLPIDETKIHGRRVQQAAFFSHGFVLFTTHEPIAEELMQLLVRFARVYDLTYRRFLDLQKAEEHAKEAESARRRIESTLIELRATQDQLIQAEKMASLGELTAGIAHEIQNPLNFVNNFSEINEDLIGEMREAIEKGDAKEAKLLANYLEENEQKIKHHGRRAEAIVKTMLQHSRKSTGKKTATNINALVGEFLQISYDGMQDKDSLFKATLKSEYDPDIGEINVIPQDIGLVLSNIYNNAFYALSEKLKQGRAGYKPVISVSTKKADGKIEIRVKDNGNGIPAEIIDKVFQPFFTTKPTGTGIGLGLSLSYDIIRMHGGLLEVISK